MPDSAAFIPDSSSRLRYLLVSALHVGLLLMLGSALYAFGIIRVVPSNTNLLQWDVLWYEQIRAAGYSYSATAMSNAAFFPLLPYLWRVSGLSLLGMGLLNAALFVSSFTWLAYHLRLPARLQLLLLSTPLLLFMVVPYTEALFFGFGTLLLLGLRRQRLLWWMLGLLGCGLTRSASTMFTPALLFMMLLWAAQPGQLRRALTYGLTGLLALAGSVGVIVFIQWQQIGEPFGFIRAQKHWGHKLSMLQLPMRDASGLDMLWLDGLGIWLGLAATGVCGWLAWQWLRRGRPALPPEVVFALGYCVSVVLFILLYQAGSAWNVARYMLANPFLVVLVSFQAGRPAWPWRRYALIGGATMLLWQIFGIYTLDFDNYNTPQALWYFGLTTAYLLAYLAWRQLPWQREVTMLLYLFNLVVMLHLLDGWLQSYVMQ